MTKAIIFSKSKAGLVPVFMKSCNTRKKAISSVVKYIKEHYPNLYKQYLTEADLINNLGKLENIRVEIADANS